MMTWRMTTLSSVNTIGIALNVRSQQRARP